MMKIIHDSVDYANILNWILGIFCFLEMTNLRLKLQMTFLLVLMMYVKLMCRRLGSLSQTFSFHKGLFECLTARQFLGQILVSVFQC